MQSVFLIKNHKKYIDLETLILTWQLLLQKRQELEIFLLCFGGGSSQTKTPVYARDTEGNCLGTGAQLDFSLAFKSSLPKFIPHSLTPSLYLIGPVPCYLLLIPESEIILFDFLVDFFSNKTSFVL